jgi:hypothetical protein
MSLLIEPQQDYNTFTVNIRWFRFLALSDRII